MSAACRVIDAASRIASSKDLCISTPGWTAQLFLEGDSVQEWEVHYLRPDLELYPGMIVLSDGDDHLALAPVEYGEDDLLGLGCFDQEPEGVWQVETVATILPPGVLPLKEKLARLVSLRILPPEVMETFLWDLARVAIQDRARIDKCWSPCGMRPVYEIRDDLVPRGKPLVELGSISIHLSREEAWKPVAIRTMPLAFSDLVIANTDELARAKEEGPTGGYYNEHDQIVWLWAVYWPGSSTLFLRKGETVMRHDIPQDSVILVTASFPEQEEQ